VLLPVALFALLFFTICAFFSVWEREVDRAHGQTSLALGGSDHEGLIRQLPLMIVVISAAAAVSGGGAVRDVALSAAVSGILLALVDRLERRAGRQPARVLADIALMTPVVVLLLRR
jgi:hypothetical protein